MLQAEPQLNVVSRTANTNREIRKSEVGAPAPREGAFILHVLDHSWPVLSGYAVRSRNLISAQSGLGERIKVITSPLHQVDDPQAEDRVLDNVEYLRTFVRTGLAKTAIERRWPLLREYEVVRALRERIIETATRDNVRLIYAHSPALCGLAGLKAARKLGLPFIYEIRAFWEDAAEPNRANSRPLRSRLTRNLETYVARRADGVAAIAKPLLEDLKSRGLPASKLFHTPNGVDVQRFRARTRDEALARELGLLARPVFGFFGSLYGYEGVSWFVRAAARLRSRGHNFSILIIGKGEDEPNIAKAIQECGASGYVRSIPHVPHEQIERFYSVVDITVYPRQSLRLTELVTPLKPLEAMALKKPVLASSVGGIRELVQNDRTGLLFKPGDVSDFCRQAERMIHSPTLCESLGECGRDFVVSERDWRILAHRYRQMYEQVLSAVAARCE